MRSKILLKITVYILIFVSVAACCGTANITFAERDISPIKVKIKNGWFYVNGEKFFPLPQGPFYLPLHPP